MSDHVLIGRIMELKNDKLVELLSYIILVSEDAALLAMGWLSKHGEKEVLPQQKVEAPVVQKSINDELVMEYWNEVQEIIGAFNTHGGGGEEGEEDHVCYLLNNASELLQEGKVGPATRMKLLEEALHEYFIDSYGFEDDLSDLCFAICQTAEEWEYFAGKLRKHPSPWNNRKLINIYLNKLKDDEAYLDLRQNNLKDGMDYWDLGSFYLARDKKEQALEIMEQGILKGEGMCTELFEYLFDYYAGSSDEDNLLRIVDTALERRNGEKMMLNKLADYYLQQGDYAKGKEAMLKGLPFVGMNGYYDEYKRLKENLKGEDWQLVKERFLVSALQNSRRNYMQICIDEGMKEEALQALLGGLTRGRTRVIYDDHIEIANQLQKDYPQEIIDYYLEKARRQIPGGNRKTYREAAGYLAMAKGIYFGELQDKHAWEKQFAALKEEFRNRPAFWDEVKHL
ncbi:MAG: hypothetical protein Q7J85_07950 [Bacillota bacterium]|nr:hypothetical protein [Bacillota bacterium]